MADASYVRCNFTGGIWSAAMQGRTDRPDYITALNDCLNYIVTETGNLVRRSGTQMAGTTRGGSPGRLIKFDFQTAAPYQMEFSDGYVRFWSGVKRATTNDDVTVFSIGTDNPATVTTTLPHGWATGDHVVPNAIGANALANRVFKITSTGTAKFTLADAVTGTAIDGSTITSVGPSATFSRIRDIATPYASGTWSSLRSVQTETQAVLLNGSVPYVLTVTQPPSTDTDATFSLAAVNFKDGPYLDPVKGGVTITPSAKTGSINLTLAYQTWSATVAYGIGDFVVFSSASYQSLTDSNINNQPDTHPGNWVASTPDAFVSSAGFKATDIGRMIRLYSEPLLWSSVTAYAVGNYVKYNNFYYIALAASTNKVPGADLTNWGPAPAAALWSWGKITALQNTLTVTSYVGDMTSNGGLASAFDGNSGQASASAATKSSSYNRGPGSWNVTLTGYVGGNLTAVPKAVTSVAVFPSSDFGFFNWTSDFGALTVNSIVFKLYASQTAPTSATNGTLLGTSGSLTSIPSAPVTLASSNTTTTWKYIWVAITVKTTLSNTSGGSNFNWTLNLYAAEEYIFQATSSGSNAVTIAVLGSALLYTTAISTFRLGLFNASTYPTCGTYSDGRLWLSGAVPNRIDASVSNDIFNFAPTGSSGAVADNNAISYTFNAPDANPIFWMNPVLQGITCGTKAGEWLITAPTAGPITPTNIAARRVTSIGCANIEPRQTEHTVVFVQKYGRKIMEYFADVYSGKFNAPHLTDKGKHLTAPGIAEIAYQQELAPIVWARRTDGALLGTTYKRDTLLSSQGPTIAGMHRHTLGSSRVVESIAVGPSVGGNIDALSMITNDTTANVRWVEVLQDLAEETTALSAQWLLDAAVVPSTTTTTDAASGGAPFGALTLYGLSHLNGKTVSVFASGLDCGDFAVSNGSIAVPYGDGISGGTASGLFTSAFAATATIVAGFTYTSQGQLVRPHAPQETGARNGPGFGKLKRSVWYGLQAYASVGGSDGGIGTDLTKLDPIQFKDLAGTKYTALQSFSGIWRAPLRDTESLDSMLAWKVTRPRPFNVTALGAFIQTKDL